MGLETYKKDLFLAHLQPGVGKNSKDLAILILEFDDVTVKTIYIWPFKEMLKFVTDPL